LLIQYGANIKAKGPFLYITPLFITVREGHYEIVRIFIQYDANTVARDSSTGVTPVFAAAHGGHREVVKLLV